MTARRLKIVVDRGRCTGIGICESMSPAHFEIGDDGALVLLRADITEADHALVESAVHSCPAGALKLVSDDDAG